MIDLPNVKQIIDNTKDIIRLKLNGETIWQSIPEGYSIVNSINTAVPLPVSFTPPLGFTEYTITTQITSLAPYSSYRYTTIIINRYGFYLLQNYNSVYSAAGSLQKGMLVSDFIKTPHTFRFYNFRQIWEEPYHQPGRWVYMCDVDMDGELFIKDSATVISCPNGFATYISGNQKGIYVGKIEGDVFFPNCRLLQKGNQTDTLYLYNLKTKQFM